MVGPCGMLQPMIYARTHSASKPYSPTLNPFMPRSVLASDKFANILEIKTYHEKKMNEICSLQSYKQSFFKCFARSFNSEEILANMSDLWEISGFRLVKGEISYLD